MSCIFLMHINNLTPVLPEIQVADKVQLTIKKCWQHLILKVQSKIYQLT